MPVQLLTQAEVDAWVAQYPTCEEILGNLQIGNPSGPATDISDISGLSNLKRVKSSNLFIGYNPGLTSLEGLHNLEQVDFTVLISDCSGLTSLEGLNSLISIGNHLIIDNNNNLLTLDGLGAITEVPGRIYLSFNPKLNDITAFSSITSVGDELDIRINLKLESLAGLENVTSIGTDLYLKDNHLLTDISALDHTLSIGETLTIENCNVLSVCSVQAVCDHIDSGGDTSIESNMTGCNGIEEIALACVPNSTNNIAGPLLTIYPNPAKDHLYIEGLSNFENPTITLFDAIGKSVDEINLSNNFIDTSAKRAGIYFLRIEDFDKYVVKRIVIL